jgi:hypothetical protein
MNVLSLYGVRTFLEREFNDVYNVIPKFSCSKIAFDTFNNLNRYFEYIKNANYTESSKLLAYNIVLDFVENNKNFIGINKNQEILSNRTEAEYSFSEVDSKIKQKINADKEKCIDSFSYNSLIFEITKFGLILSIVDVVKLGLYNLRFFFGGAFIFNYHFNVIPKFGCSKTAFDTFNNLTGYFEHIENSNYTESSKLLAYNIVLDFVENNKNFIGISKNQEILSNRTEAEYSFSEVDSKIKQKINVDKEKCVNSFSYNSLIFEIAKFGLTLATANIIKQYLNR